MYRSFILVIFFLLISCNKIEHTPKRSGYLATNWFLREYKEIKNDFSISYLSYISDRLGNALNLKHSSKYKIKILNTNTPLAVSPGGGYILISKGLIKNLNNEAELSFIISHEIAHQHLGHTNFTDHRELKDKQKKYELSADKFATGMIAIAGYDPRAAIGALNNSYRYFSYENISENYPDFEKRILQLKLAINKSGWRPPGTLDTREFRKFKKLL